jgi:hypothetical protein
MERINRRRVVEFFSAYNQVTQASHFCFSFALDFFLVVCDIKYQLSLLLSILHFFDEVNSALSFQTILFSRFSYLCLKFAV